MSKRLTGTVWLLDTLYTADVLCPENPQAREKMGEGTCVDRCEKEV